MTRLASRFPVPLLVCLGAAVCGLAAAPAWLPQPVRVERTVFLMGTVATFVAEAIDRESGLAKLERMVRVIEETEAALSTWRDDSVLSAVNRQPVGEPLPVPDETCSLLARVAAWHETSGGAFDPAVGRLIDAWGLRGAARQPDDASLEAARAASGLEHLVLDTETCAVTRRAAVILDAGAFGKGEALDRVREAERDRPGAWFIDFGGADGGLRRSGRRCVVDRRGAPGAARRPGLSSGGSAAAKPAAPGRTRAPVNLPGAIWSGSQIRPSALAYQAGQ